MLGDVTWRKLLTRSAASGEQKTGMLYLRCQQKTGKLYLMCHRYTVSQVAASGEQKTGILYLRCQFLYFGTSKQVN